ncbi:uncharacterized protein AAES06_017097 [Glossophaga mutica]
MQVLEEPKCGPTWSGLEKQGGQVGSPGRAQSSSTPTVSSHQHKALGSPCFSHLRRQQVSTVYLGSLISIFLYLQMPILAAGKELLVQGPCRPLIDILDGKTDLTCKLQYPKNVENIQKTCATFPDYKLVYQCEDGRDGPEKAMTEFADLQVIRAGPEMCNGTRTLTLSNNSWYYNCTFKNGSSSSAEQKVEDAEFISMTVLIMVSAVTVLILLILIGLRIKRNKLKTAAKTVSASVAIIVIVPVLAVIRLIANVFNKNNWWKNRSSRSQPSLCHRTSLAIQPSYVPAPNTDPEDDLHSVATDGNADTATATADAHDSVPGETSINPTEDPYPSGTATVDTFLTADSESDNAYDSEAQDSTYCDSYDSVSLGAEACGSAVAAFLEAEVKNEPLSKYDSQKQVEMQVFAMNRQVYNPEYR